MPICAFVKDRPRHDRRYAIDATQLEALARPLAKSGYGEYLLRILGERARG